MPRVISNIYDPDKLNEWLMKKRFTNIAGLPCHRKGEPEPVILRPNNGDVGRFGEESGWMIIIPSLDEIWAARLPVDDIDEVTLGKLCPNGLSRTFSYLPEGSTIPSELLADRFKDPYSDCDGRYPPLDELRMPRPVPRAKKPFFSRFPFAWRKKREPEPFKLTMKEIVEATKAVDNGGK